MIKTNKNNTVTISLSIDFNIVKRREAIGHLDGQLLMIRQEVIDLLSLNIIKNDK